MTPASVAIAETPVCVLVIPFSPYHTASFNTEGAISHDMIKFPSNPTALNPVTRQLISDHSFLIGNITPVSWYQHIRTAPTPTKPNGSPDMAAVAILSDIMYWYRPTEIRDESTGNVIDYRTKFAADKLQKRYQAYADMLGVSKAKTKLSFDLLVKLGLITREFRTITVGDMPVSNVMFIEPVINAVIRISVPTTFTTPSPQKTPPPPHKKRGDVYRDHSNKRTYVRAEPQQQPPHPPSVTPTTPPSAVPQFGVLKTELNPPATETQVSKKSAKNDLLKTLIDLVPVEMRKPSVIAKIAGAVKDGIVIATIQGCIFYSNEHSDQKSWQRYRSYLGRCLEGQWGEGYTREDAGKAQGAKDRAALQGRRGLPDQALKIQAQTGDRYAKQVLQERGIS